MIYSPVRERKSQARYFTVTLKTESLLILVLLHKKWKKKGEQTKQTNQESGPASQKQGKQASEKLNHL